MIIPKKKKVVVALSGGVDSSVAAVLLKKAGFEIIGVFMKLYGSMRFKEGEERAKKIAQILNIPFLRLDLRKEFKKKIINYFLKGYKKGLTPNPCVVCNKEIKFGLLLEKALKLRGDFVVTGHYVLKRETKNHLIAKQLQGAKRLVRKSKIKNYKLLKARDKKKDQSYFLWMLNQGQLKRILFPLGDYTKNQVSKLAKRLNLPIFEVPESQEVCFIEKTVNDFLKKHLKKIKPGKIIDSNGKILSNHLGLPFYTIGQRKGIRLPGGPYFVLDKDLKKIF